MKHLLVILLFVAVLTVSSKAQQGQGNGPAKAVTEIFTSGSTAVVKGAPFSAEGISESVQTLSDGNRITRSNTTRMFRDSDGRFRREGSASPGSNSISYSYASAGFGSGSGFGFVSQDTISIFDPVSNLRYTLNPATKTARRTSSQSGFGEGTVVFNYNSPSTSPALKAQVETNPAQKSPVELSRVQKSQIVVLPGLAATYRFGAGKTESLGTRAFEDVEAEGTRTTTVIPAEAIGNERPIEIVYERWYSKELQMIVYSRQSDPRFGEQTYRLTNINRSEPDRALFAPPADYKIVAEQKFTFATPASNVVTKKPL